MCKHQREFRDVAEKLELTLLQQLEKVLGLKEGISEEYVLPEKSGGENFVDFYIKNGSSIFFKNDKVKNRVNEDWEDLKSKNPILENVKMRMSDSAIQRFFIIKDVCEGVNIDDINHKKSNEIDSEDEPEYMYLKTRVFKAITSKLEEQGRLSLFNDKWKFSFKTLEKIDKQLNKPETKCENSLKFKL